MAFKSSKFNIVPKGSFSGTYSDYTIDILTKFKTAFINTNTGWSLQSDIERIGTNTSDNYGGSMTLQLKSSASNEYLRIWVFTSTGYPRAYFVTTDTASGDYDHFNLHVNNVFRYYYSSNVTAVLSPSQSIYFGVSDNPIDADFGNDLGLKCPLFGISNTRGSSVTGSMQLSDYRSGYLSNEGATFTVITDGKMFGVIKLKPSSYSPACFYAPDMFICANSSDTEQAGVISSSDGGNFYLGDNNGGSMNVTPLFCKADGTFDFSDMRDIGVKPEKQAIQASASSNKLVCGPIVVYTRVGTYAGSTFTGVTSGIGIKGWINTDYIRNTDCDALPYASRGLKYVSGRWLCIDAGTLICWDDSNSSPFEAAT